MKKLRILLIEDTDVHRQAAIKQLDGHDLTICEDFKQFCDLASKKSLKEKGFIDKNERDASEFDVILTDCLMPPNASAYVHQEGHSTEQVPYGIIILLWAIQNDIPKIGMLMLNNHHDHPIAAGLDIIGGYRRDVIKHGNNTEILISTGNYYMEDKNGEFYSSKLRGTQGQYIKQWGLFLQKLMGEASW